MPYNRRRAQARANTTPVYDHAVRRSFLATVFRMLLVPLLLLGGLAWFGQPALRIEYSWHGHPDHPTYTRCVYLALDGWHQVKPVFGVDQCPLVAFLPLDLPAFLFGQ